MATQTPNYGLTKPDATDAYDIAVPNANADAIDGALHTLEAAKVPQTRTVNGKPLSSNVTLGPGDIGAVPTSRTVNGKALSTNVTLTPADVGSPPTSRTVNGHALTGDVTLTPGDVSAVPLTRTINNKALSSDVVLTPADLGAVPNTRTVNTKPLSSDITLAAADVGAVPTTRTINGKELSSNVTLTPEDVGSPDMETGTWTPRIYVNGVAQGNAGTGIFIRYGKIVYIQFGGVGVGSWTQTGSAFIRGVPYASAYQSGIVVSHNKSVGESRMATAYIYGDTITPLIKVNSGVYLGSMGEIYTSDFSQGISFEYCSGVYSIN